MDSSDNSNSAVPAKIQRLRNKLLDLTNKNPLLSTKLNSSRSSYIRVVDELPDILFSRLHNQEEFAFKSLPHLPLEENPEDEQRTDFQDRLAEAHINDPDYKKEIEEIDPSDENTFIKEQNAERRLRDRIRTELGMSPRKTMSQPLAEHAREHGISPHYDLPSQTGKKEHEDDLIQTLLLPDNLERLALRLIRKNREWQEETGINVMHAAFGFLEWTDPARNKNVFSPLVLLPVKIEERKTPDGLRLCVEGLDDPSERNNALAEKLWQDFRVELPEYESNHSIEDYMEAVDRTPHGSISHWRVRRYIAFGVFPSMRLAMYNDLDIAETSLSNEIVTKILGEEQEVVPAIPADDDYKVDDPSIESQVSILLDRADSSQFSTMVEIARNVNLAVEGPPGTGKSQTIVNIIGAALADGKKVLFVAEKMAALEVVRSRLKHLGIEEFTLPLQPNHSSRKEVVDSLVKRLAMVPEDSSENYEKKKLEFENVRNDIDKYINLIKSRYRHTGLTIHEIIGLGIRTGERLKSLPPNIVSLELDFSVDRDQIKRIKEIAGRLEDVWKSVRDTRTLWSKLNIDTQDKFTLDDIRNRIAGISTVYKEIDGLCGELADLGFKDLSGESANLPANQLKALARIKPSRNLHSLEDSRQDTEKIRELLSIQKELDHLDGSMEAEFNAPIEDTLAGRLCEMRETLWEIRKERGPNTASLGELRENQLELARENGRKSKELGEFTRQAPPVSRWRIKTLATVTQILRETDQDLLLLRNSATADPKERLLIEKDLKTGSDLAGHREEMEKHFRTEKISSAAEISELEATIKSGGVLSFLSSKHRAARRKYMNLSREEGFDKKNALEKLSVLGEWAKRKKEFLEEKRLQNAFGEHFRGIDTDFKRLGELLDYCRRVEKEFGFADRDAKDFLFSAPPDLLHYVQAERPGWLADTSDGQMTVQGLAEELESQGSALRRKNDAIERFGEISGCLKSGSVWTLRPNDLSRLADLAEKHAKLRKSAEEHPLRASLEQRLEGEGERSAIIEKNLDIANVLLEDPGWTEILRRIMIRNEIEQAGNCTERFLANLRKAESEIKNLREKTGIDIEGFLQGGDYPETGKYLFGMSEDEEGIARHANYSATRREMEREGMGRWVDELLDSDAGLYGLAETLEAIIGRALLGRVNREYPEILRDYSGQRLDVLRERFVEADKDFLRSSRQYLRDRLVSGARPPRGNGKGKVSTHTELSLINHEINKKKRHIPLRSLIRRSRAALLELKPCWMMSPLAVAQYLERDGEKFDLCIIDEASQMTPENAMGALMRSKQVMVVGDTNQLPPSNFFRKMISDDDVDEDEDVLEESILEMANQAFAKRRLRWHYRSRDDSLIRYSNHKVYDNDLIIFPSPKQGFENGRMGVSLKRVVGNYKSGINMAEAKIVIEEILRFMKEQPDRSLGVVTMNKKQQELMEEQFQYSFRNSPEALEYVDHWKSHKEGLESFFIKNLESVQGDERDVIFISTVYGAEKPGQKVAQRFGPINGIAGMRRLNVLFTRAKEQIVTFSSMDANDITARNPGTEMLRGWLEYCATGILDSGEISAEGGEPESDFEAHVGGQIKALGCEIEYQVGVGKYRIDIGVKHPEWPHGFLLGVECDGATYHSSRSARERDRYRQEILEGLGWHFHRIWSTNWFNNQASEVRKLHARINETLAERKQKLEEQKAPQPYAADPAEQEEQPAMDMKPPQRTPSEEAGLESGLNIVELGDRILIVDSDTRGKLEFRLAAAESDPTSGTISVEAPLGKALLGAELGEEVEFLTDNRIHLVTVEKIVKAESSA